MCVFVLIKKLLENKFIEKIFIFNMIQKLVENNIKYNCWIIYLGRLKTKMWSLYLERKKYHQRSSKTILSYFVMEHLPTCQKDLLHRHLLFSLNFRFFNIWLTFHNRGSFSLHYIQLSS